MKVGWVWYGAGANMLDATIVTLVGLGVFDLSTHTHTQIHIVRYGAESRRGVNGELLNCLSFISSIQ